MSNKEENKDVEGGGEYEGGAQETLEPRKEGHLLFGILCDMRVAVIAVNIINILLLLIGMSVYIHKYGWSSVSSHFPGFVVSAIGLFGALNFQLWAVVLAAIGFVISLINAVYWQNWVGVFVGLLVLYPHAALAHDLRMGIMTKENYRRGEEFVMV
jgi:hypothetical protein